MKVTIELDDTLAMVLLASTRIAADRALNRGRVDITKGYDAVYHIVQRAIEVAKANEQAILDAQP